MSIDNKTTTSGNVYAPTEIGKTSVKRMHSTLGSPLLPKTLEISHSANKQNSVARHMEKLSVTKVDANGNKGSKSIHYVITDSDPYGVIGTTDTSALFDEFAVLTANANLLAVSKGQL